MDIQTLPEVDRRYAGQSQSNKESKVEGSLVRWREVIRDIAMKGFLRRDSVPKSFGVQFALNIAVFKLAHAIYPVFDAERLSDKSGNVLPDVYLMPAGSRLDDLARLVHTDLDKGLLYAIDVRTGLHLPTNYVLMDRDVLSIVSMVRRA